MSGWERYIDSSIALNKTYCYLFPIIGVSQRIVKDDFVGLRGVFLRNEDYPELPDVLHLLFRKTHEKRQETLRASLLSSHEYYHHYEPDKDHFIIIMRVPGEYYKEYDKFMDGKYSELSDNYKQIIIKFHGYTKKKDGEGKSIIEVLYKEEPPYLKWEKLTGSSIPRSQEAGSRWDANLETIMKETYSHDLKVEQLLSN